MPGDFSISSPEIGFQKASPWGPLNGVAGVVGIESRDAKSVGPGHTWITGNIDDELQNSRSGIDCHLSLCNENIPLRAADELWRKPARLLPPDVPQELSSGRARSPTCADRFHRLSVEHLNRCEIRCREHKRRRGSSQMSVVGKVDSLWRYPVKSAQSKSRSAAVPCVLFLSFGSTGGTGQ
jgi:hypothetical protein